MRDRLGYGLHECAWWWCTLWIAGASLLARAQAGPEPAVGLNCLRRAYPEQICGVETETLVLCNGARFDYDDGRRKTHAERLEHADLEDMLAQRYPTAAAATAPAKDIDPGRVRHLPLFDAMYGATLAQVKKQLTTIPWMPNSSRVSIQVTQVNGVAEHLRAVSTALERLPEAVRAQAAQLAGTFNFRNIAGTERRSAHAYGIAIDVAPALSDYFRWREPGQSELRRYRNRMPQAIIEAFEREGFIWGGRWYHYDTMHFEYRPELLQAECRDEPVAVAAKAPSSELRYAWLQKPASTWLDQRLTPPAGFTRIPLAADSFGAWLRHVPLRPKRSEVRLFDGTPKHAQDLHVAVLDLDTGKRDLQQCADAVMRLRAEYLFSAGRAEEICFRAASGEPMPYAAYRRGQRPPAGRAGPWTASAEPDASWTGFRAYLDRVFGLANTASLLRDLQRVDAARTIEPGDVYLEPARGGRFGHAVLVLDVAANAAGERVFVIAQSYMPAQDMHVLINPRDAASSPWYKPSPDGALVTPEWTFPPGSLRRFGAACQSR